MARIFITGSADGLGLLAAKELIRLKHDVVLHVRNEERAKQILQKAPGAAGVLIADLLDMEATKALAAKANATGNFDAVIHNAGIISDSKAGSRISGLLRVNTLAPYILTCLMQKPKRLIYLSSGMHTGGSANINHLHDKYISYSDTKLYDLILAKAFARKWNDVYANAVNPGWVPTKMGGAGAPDNLEKGYQTQVWLAVSNEEKAKVSGRYFFHQKESHYKAEVDNELLQERFLNVCKEMTGVSFPH